VETSCQKYNAHLFIYLLSLIPGVFQLSLTQATILSVPREGKGAADHAPTTRKLAHHHHGNADTSPQHQQWRSNTPSLEGFRLDDWYLRRSVAWVISVYSPAVSYLEEAAFLVFASLSRTRDLERHDHRNMPATWIRSAWKFEFGLEPPHRSRS